jgi:hypothetical protein
MPALAVLAATTLAGVGVGLGATRREEGSAGIP